MIVTLGSSRMLAGSFPSAKETPACRFEQLVDLDAGCGFFIGHSGSCLTGDKRHPGDLLTYVFLAANAGEQASICRIA